MQPAMAIGALPLGEVERAEAIPRRVEAVAHVVVELLRHRERLLDALDCPSPHLLDATKGGPAKVVQWMVNATQWMVSGAVDKTQWMVSLCSGCNQGRTSE